MKRLTPALALICTATLGGAAQAGGGYEFHRHHYAPTPLASTVTNSVAGSYVSLPSANVVYQTPAPQWQTVYVSPHYGNSIYQAAPAQISTAPTYNYAPTYSYAPAQPATYYGTSYSSVALQHDASEAIRGRIKRQKARILSARARGVLSESKTYRLREKMREIRSDFRNFRDNDGRVGRVEEQILTEKLDRQSRRIARLSRNYSGRSTPISGTVHGYAYGYNNAHY